jgi:hypothetical protein
MPSKVQAYAQMADHVAAQITGSHKSWTDFPTTAARLYKNSFIPESYNCRSIFSSIVNVPTSIFSSGA